MPSSCPSGRDGGPLTSGRGGMEATRDQQVGVGEPITLSHRRIVATFVWAIVAVDVAYVMALVWDVPWARDVAAPRPRAQPVDLALERIAGGHRRCGLAGRAGPVRPPAVVVRRVPAPRHVDRRGGAVPRAAGPAARPDPQQPARLGHGRGRPGGGGCRRPGAVGPATRAPSAAPPCSPAPSSSSSAPWASRRSAASGRRATATTRCTGCSRASRRTSR